MTDGRITKGNETKEKILQATLLYIADHGIKGMSAAKIAKLAGVSKSNIFHHFDSVEDLPFKCMSHLCDNLMASVDAYETSSLEELLLNVGDMTFIEDVYHQKTYRAFFTLYNESFHDQRYKVIIENMKDKYIEAIVDAVNYYEKDVIDQKGLKELAHLITIIIDGMGMHYLIDGDPGIYIKLWTLQVQMILKEVDMLKKNR